MANAFKNVTVQGTLAADADHAVGSVIPNATTTQTIIGMTVANVSSPAEDKEEEKIKEDNQQLDDETKSTEKTE